MNLTLSGVGFSYSPVCRLFHDLSLSFSRGIVTGIAGPNGSGKSTLLKLLSRVLKPLDGTIRLGDRRIDSFNMRAYARQVAWVPQEFSLPFPMTVQDLVSLGRYAALGMFGSLSDEDNCFIQKALESMELANHAGRPVAQLSGGERKRVMLARAMAQNPDIFLLDEPFAHLDPHHQVHMSDIIRQLCHDGHSLVVVSHQVNFLIQVCDEMVLIDQGRLQRHLKDKSMFSDPRIWMDLFSCPFETFNREDSSIVFPKVDGGGAP